MMRLPYVVFVVHQLFNVAHGWGEFGRDVTFKAEAPARKRKAFPMLEEHKIKREQQHMMNEDFFEHLLPERFMEELSFSLSMSLSMAPVPFPVGRDDTVPPSTDPTRPPTTPRISDRPTASLAPTQSTTNTPSNPNTSSPSASPSSNGSTSNVPTDLTTSRPTTSPSSNDSASSGPTDFTSSIPTTSPPSSDSVSNAPSTLATTLPTTIPSSTVAPTPSQAPSAASAGQNVTSPELAFDCVDNGILSLGEAFDTNTSAVYLYVGYLVESISNSTEGFLDELEHHLLLTAVAAALGCDRPTTRHRRSLFESSKKISMNSIIVDSIPCEPSVDAAESCNIIETDLVFFLKGDVDTDRAAYSGYSAIESKMTNDGLIGVVPSVRRLVYLSPLPLPAPPQLTEDIGTSNTTTVITSGGNNLPVSPWTIGACVASIFGGVVSMLVWSRNRRNRHRRHMQLVEDSSLVQSYTRNPVSV